MALAPGHFATVHTPPAIAPPERGYSGNLLVLGTSWQGPLMEPIRVTSESEAQAFGEGELLQAYRESMLAGQESVWLFRLGDPGISDQQRHDRLLQAYEALAGFPAHVIVPYGVRLKSGGPDFAGALADFIMQYEPFGIGMGVLATEDVDFENLQSSLTSVLQAPHLRRQLGFRGSALAVVMSPVLTRLGEWINPAVMYAAMQSLLSPAVSLTNRRLEGLLTAGWRGSQGVWEQELTFTAPGQAITLERRPLGSVEIEGYEEDVDYSVDEDQWLIRHLPEGRLPTPSAVVARFGYSDYDSLADAGITAFIDRPARGVFSTTAVTLGPSPFRFQGNVRALQAVLESVYAATDPWIGHPVTDRGGEMSVEQAVLDALERSREQGVLRAFRVEFVWGRNRLEVLLELALYHEIRAITTQVSLRVG